jgi:hypothetical protein
MIKKTTISIEGKTATNYKVDASDLHVFIADTIKRLGGIHYMSDTYLDYENMLHNMNEGGGYIWSIRETGTWFMPILTYSINQPDQFTTPLIRYVVTRHDDTYSFIEYIQL